MSARDDRLVDLTEVARRTLLARNGDHHLVEDLTQETIVKVAAVADRLSDDALRAYAVVTARNALVDHYRNHATAQRHAHRLVEYRSFDGPEQLSLEREETDALAVALDRLDDHDRQLLVAHESEGTPLAQLAADHHTTDRAISMRLARARAVLRVEFVLAIRRIEHVPTQCRNNLIALSAGDKRRQDELGTAEHLLRCPACADMSKPVIQRRRNIAAWLLLAPAEALRRYASSLRHSRTTQIATIATTAAAVTIAYVVAQPDMAQPGLEAAAESTVATTAATTTPPAPTSSPAVVTAPPTDPCLAAADATIIDATLDSCPFTLIAAPVTDVPADEGFWITAPDGQPAWVRIVGPGESPQQVSTGQTITLTGTIRSNTGNLDATPEQQADINARSAHLEVPYTGITIDAP